MKRVIFGAIGSPLDQEKLIVIRHRYLESMKGAGSTSVNELATQTIVDTRELDCRSLTQKVLGIAQTEARNQME